MEDSILVFSQESVGMCVYTYILYVCPHVCVCSACVCGGPGGFCFPKVADVMVIREQVG